MTALLIEGFDHLGDYWRYTADWDKWFDFVKWETHTEGPNPAGVVTGRLGVGSALEQTVGGKFIYHSITSGSSFVVGVSVHTGEVLTSWDYRCPFLVIKKGSRRQLYVIINGFGFFEVWKGAPDPDTDTMLARSTNRYSADSWVTVEFKCHIGTTDGSFELRVDGETECSDSNVNTLGQDDDVAFVIGIGSGGLQDAIYFDDFYIFDTNGSINNTFTQGLQVSMMNPDGNGASSQWTGSDGNQTDNYLLLNESTPNKPDTSYVGAYGAGYIDSYTFNSLSFSPLNIRAVQLNALNWRGSVQARDFALMARISSTNYFSENVASWEHETCRFNLWETNPNTGTAWTKAVLDGAEFGIKVI